MCVAICEDTVNGLLGTQVTWDDVQEDCFNLFGPLAKLGPNKTIKDIADGKGSISRIGVVENPWEDPTTAVKNGCPGKFVVKVATALQQEKYNKDKMDEQTRDWMIQAVFRLHNVECRLYEKIKDVQGLSRLKVYVSHPFTDENLSMGYLIMEYAENVANLGADTHLEKDLFLEILETLAKYHSCSVLFNDEEKESLKMGIVEGVFGCMLKQSFVDSCLEITSKVLGDDAVDTVERCGTIQ